MMHTAEANVTATAAPTPRAAVAQVSAVLGIVADEAGRRRLEAVLANGPFKIAAAAETIDALLDRAREPADVVIMTAGAETLARGGPVERLRNLRPACSIVIVADGEDRALVRKALRVGVDGYVPDRAVPDVLAVTISAVRAGQLAVPRSISDRASWAAFSIREREILKLENA